MPCLFTLKFQFPQPHIPPCQHIPVLLSKNCCKQTQQEESENMETFNVTMQTKKLETKKISKNKIHNLHC